MIRILLADDHEVLREGIRKAFDSAGEEVIGEAADGEQAVAMAGELEPDVIVMDLTMPIMDGVEATRRIKSDNPEISVVVLTMHDDVIRTRKALEAGAAGFLSKGCAFSDVLETVRAVAGGETGLSAGLADSILKTAQDTQELLSPREVEILQLVADGDTTKEAARDLGITRKTVHNHLNSAYRKLDTQNLTHAVLSAVRLGIIEVHE